MANHQLTALGFKSDFRENANSNDIFTWVQNGSLSKETANNYNIAFGPKTAKERSVQWFSKKFRKKRIRALRMRSLVASHRKLTTTGWEQLAELIFLQLHGKLLKNSVSTVVRRLKQNGKVKKLDNWVPHGLTQIKSTAVFEADHDDLMIWNSRSKTVITYAPPPVILKISKNLMKSKKCIVSIVFKFSV